MNRLAVLPFLLGVSVALLVAHFSPPDAGAESSRDDLLPSFTIRIEPDRSEPGLFRSILSIEDHLNLASQQVESTSSGAYGETVTFRLTTPPSRADRAPTTFRVELRVSRAD